MKSSCTYGLLSKLFSHNGWILVKFFFLPVYGSSHRPCTIMQKKKQRADIQLFLQNKFNHQIGYFITWHKERNFFFLGGQSEQW